MAQLVHNCARYVMRSRKHAVLLALLFTVLPLFTWLSTVIMLLVTLRQGAREGAIIVLWIVLPHVVQAVLQQHLVWIYAILAGSLLPYTFALLLRQTGSWAILLQSAVLLALGVITLIHLFNPDIQTFWAHYLTQSMTLAKQYIHTLPILDKQNLLWVAKLATGLQASIFLIATLSNLIIARGIQASLYNPGQLRPELLGIRLHKSMTLVFLLFLLARFLNFTLAYDGLPVLLLLFSLVGWSAVHSASVLLKLSKLQWFALYICLFIFLPYSACLLIVLACIDSCFDTRRYLQSKFISH